MKFLFTFLTLFIICNTQAQSSKKGDSLMSIGQYSKAIIEYKKSSSPAKYFKIAKAQEANNDIKKALLNYENYTKIDSTNIEVNFNYGLLLLNSRQVELAQSKFEKLITTNPNEVYYYNLGLCFEQKKDFENTQKNYLKAIDYNQKYYPANYKMAHIYAKNSQIKKSLNICNTFLIKNPNDINFLKLRGQLFFIQLNFKSAITDFEKLINLNQTDIFIYEKLALSYFRVEKYQKSLDIYNYLIDTDDLSPTYYYNRGKCHGFLNNLTAAENDIKTSISLKKITFENEYFLLGYFYQKENNLQKALYYYQKVIKEDKNHWL